MAGAAMAPNPLAGAMFSLLTHPPHLPSAIETPRSPVELKAAQRHLRVPSQRSRFNAYLRRAAGEEARYRALIDALREPVIVTNAQHRISALNAAAIALFGGTLKELYGRPIQDVLPFVPAPAAMEDGSARAMLHGTVVDPSGRSVDLDVSLTVLGQGLAAERVYVVHDISQHAQLNRMREQLLYNVAHELRGPLSVLNGVLDIVAVEYAELPAAELGQLLGSAQRTSRRLSMLMEDLLSAGSIQSGRFKVSPQPTELGSIVEDALETVQSIVAGRSQLVAVDLPADDLLVLADRRYVRQVLANLLANASKYSPEHTLIHVRAAPADSEGAVRVVVEDHGPGIPQEQQAGLFERFYRAQDERHRPGFGLGLAIAKSIVDAHGGTIGVDSQVGVGTRVWLTLPTATGRDEDPAAGR